LAAAHNDANVLAGIETSGKLVITGAAILSASTASRQQVNSLASAGGLIGVGAATATGDVTSSTKATIGEKADITAGSLAIWSVGEDTSDVTVKAGAFGLASGAAAKATTDINSDVLAGIVDAASLANKATVTVIGTFEVAAAHTATPSANISTDAKGALAGSGATVAHDVTSQVKANFGKYARVTAGTFDIDATNRLGGSSSIDGKTGGLVSGASADVETVVDFDTIIAFGAASVITATNDTGSLKAVVFNALDQSLKAKLVTGGALSGAGAYVDFDGKNVLGEITVGEGAQVIARGGLEFEVDGRTNINLQSYSETFGAATVALGHAKGDVVPTNRILILANAKVLAADDMYLSAGTDRDLNLPEHALEMRVDNFAGSVIPISDLETRALYEAHNLVRIDSGAVVEGYSNIDLNADGFNIASVVGVAKATSWASALGSALGGGNVGSGPGATRSVIMGDVVNNGTVRTGAQRSKTLTLIVNAAGDTVVDPTRSSMTTENGVTTSDITFTAGRATLSSSQFDMIAQARSNIQQYADNATLVAFYNAQIARIEEDLLAQGLAEEVTVDGVTTIVPMTPEIDTVTIDRVKAAAGRVRIFADQLSGVGTFDVPKNASITIRSESFAQLVIGDIEIPDINGGIYFNGTDITGIGDTTTSVSTALMWVNGENLRNKDRNNSNLAGIGANDSLKTAVFSLTAASIDRSSSIPQINISVSDIAGFATLETLPPQEIRITGNIIARSSKVTITNPSNGGSITILGQVAAAEFAVVAKSSVAISGAVIQTVGGDPYGQLLNANLAMSGTVNVANNTGKVTSWLGTQPTTPSIMANRITISAEYLDVNGLIQSGKQDYTLVLDAAQKTQIDRARQSGANITPITVAGNSDFSLVYNRQTDALVVKALRPTGGYIELTGNVMNTRNGQVTAYSGYPQVTVTNNMALPGLDLTFESIDADVRGDGIIKINDKTKGKTTIYTKQASGDVKVETINFGSPTTSTSTLTGAAVNSIKYDPSAGYRYAWSVGVSSRTLQSSRWSTSSWLGTFDLGSSSVKGPIVAQTLNASLVPNSNYYYLDAAKNGTVYT
jgi:hypothetical protein